MNETVNKTMALMAIEYGTESVNKQVNEAVRESVNESINKWFIYLKRKKSGNKLFNWTD